MDWTTTLPYTLITSIILIGIGIYGIITGRKFIRIIFSLEILFLSSILLLISFGLGTNNSDLIPDAFAHVISLFIMIVNVVFLIIGTSIDRSLRQKGDSTLIEFDFTIDDVHLVTSPEKEVVNIEGEK